MAHDVAAAGFDGCGACVAGEVIGAGEPVDVVDVAEDLGGEHVAYPGEAGEGGAAGGHRVRAASAVVGCGLVEAPHVGEELSGHLLALGLDAVAGAGLGEQTRRGVSAEVGGRAAGDQVAQVPVQPVDGSAAFAGELVAAVREQPEHAMVIVRSD